MFTLFYSFGELHMNDTSQRALSMGRRVKEFTAANPTSFTSGSRASLLITQVNAAVQELEQQGSKQDTAVASGREATERKKGALANMLSRMRPLSGTARGMEKLSRGIGDRFRMPRGSEQSAINRAQAFMAEGETMAAEFTSRGLPATFLSELSASITEVESAREAQDQARREESAATAALSLAEQQLLDTVRELSPVVRNIFRNDPARLASWESASHVERAPRRKKTTPTPPPPPPPT
jgi:HPt (histidine-containing phosphotransfer) domain-containing protein